MKYSLLKRISAFVLAFALVFTTAFNTTVGANAAAKGKVTGIAVKSAKVTVTVGAKKTVKVKVTAKNGKKAVKTAAFGKITAKSSNKKVATVTRKNGKSGGFNSSVIIKGVKAGKATITVTTVKKNAKNKKISKKITVTVKAKATTATTASSNATTSTPPTTEAVAATGIALDAATKSVEVGSTFTLLATTTPTNATDAITWTSSNEKVATVTAGVVAGVAEGTATITAKVGTYTASCIVTVVPAKVTAKLTAIKQTKSNELELTFDVDAKTVVNKSDVKVARVDGLGVIPVNTLTWSEDGKVATATLANPLADGVDYQVTYQDGAAQAFKASVGAVANIQIKTASAEQNIATKIEYGLFDATGVDVTSTVKLDEVIEVSVEPVEGSDVTSDTSKPSAPTVTMTKVGDKATVTVKYVGTTTNTVSPASAVITCVAATATVGKARFKRASVSGVKTWADGECARFYTGTDDTSLKVTAGDGIDDVYFCAEDLKSPGTILKYDKYEVKSSDDDILSATIADDGTGKYTKFSISGIKKGTANVLVSAEKNGAAYVYTLPVTVLDEKDLTSIKVTADRSTMSNAIDYDYIGKLKVTGTYNDGSTATLSPSDVSLEIVDKDKNQKLSANLISAASGEANATRFGAEPFTVLSNGTYFAYGAKGQDYTIKATTNDSNGKEISARVTVKVQDLDKAAWNVNGMTGGAMDYSVEFGTTTLDTAGTSATTARLIANCNKKFAGYVRINGAGVATIGTGLGYTVGAPAYGVNTTVSGNGYVRFTSDEVGVKSITATITKDAVEGVIGYKKITVTHAADGDGGDLTIGDTTVTVGNSATPAQIVNAISLADFSASAYSVSGDADEESFWLVQKVANTGAVPTPATAEEVTFSAGTSVAGVTETRSVTVNSSYAVTIHCLDGASAEAIAAQFNAADYATRKGLTASVTTDSHSYSGQNANTSSAAGSAKATAATQISNVYIAAKYGSKYSTTGKLYNSATNVNGELITKDDDKGWSQDDTIYLSAADSAGAKYVVGKASKYDVNFAKAGSYSVVFAYTQDGKFKTAESKFTVKDGWAALAPTVSINNRKVDGFDSDSIKAAISISCDMNNNDSTAASYAGNLYKSDVTSVIVPAVENNGKMPVAFIGVNERGIEFVCPASGTLYTE